VVAAGGLDARVPHQPIDVVDLRRVEERGAEVARQHVRERPDRDPDQPPLDGGGREEDGRRRRREQRPERPPHEPIEQVERGQRREDGHGGVQEPEVVLECVGGREREHRGVAVRIVRAEPTRGAGAVPPTVVRRAGRGEVAGVRVRDDARERGRHGGVAPAQREEQPAPLAADLGIGPRELPHPLPVRDELEARRVVEPLDVPRPRAGVRPGVIGELEGRRDVLGRAAGPHLLVRSVERVRGVRVAVARTGRREEQLKALAVPADERDRVRVHYPLRTILVRPRADGPQDLVLAEPLRRPPRELRLPGLPRRVGVRRGEVEHEHLAVHEVLDPRHDQRVPAAELARVALQHGAHVRRRERRPDARPRRDHHVQVLPVPLVLVGAVVVRVEEPELQHELQAVARPRDERMHVDLLELLELPPEPIAELRVELGPPALRTVSREVEVRDRERIVARPICERARAIHARRVGVEVQQEPEERAVVDERGGVRIRCGAGSAAQGDEIDLLPAHELRRRGRELPAVEVDREASRPRHEALPVHRDVPGVPDHQRREARGEREEQRAARVVDPILRRRVHVAGRGAVAPELHQLGLRRRPDDARVLERHVLEVGAGRDLVCPSRERLLSRGARRERREDDEERCGECAHRGDRTGARGGPPSILRGRRASR